nr:MAG TPA: hypothetical protein [Caudoviricetes sp.]
MTKINANLFVMSKINVIFATCLTYKHRAKSTKKGRETRMFN